MTKGQIKLNLDTGNVVYIVNRAGEAFGWSSLIGRDVYSATAECISSTNLLKLNGETLHKILERDTDNGMIFFKRLAIVLGNRLLQSYNMISSAAQAESSISFGTGQVLASEETEA
jgi:CRP-like cAMP-binding protein